MELNWIEISKQNLIHNYQEFKNLVGKDVVLAPVINRVMRMGMISRKWLRFFQMQVQIIYV